MPASSGIGGRPIPVKNRTAKIEAYQYSASGMAGVPRANRTGVKHVAFRPDSVESGCRPAAAALPYQNPPPPRIRFMPTTRPAEPGFDHGRRRQSVVRAVLSGYLGKAQVVAFKGEPDAHGNETWDVFVSEPRQEARQDARQDAPRPAPASEAARQREGAQRAPQPRQGTHAARLARVDGG